MYPEVFIIDAAILLTQSLGHCNYNSRRALLLLYPPSPALFSL